MKPIPSSTSILATLLLLVARPPRQASAQTAAGCSATCPPVGYESDSSHLCPGDVLDDASARRGHAICHPTATSNNKKAIDLDSSFKRPGHVTVIANYYTGCEAGRRESGVYAGMAQAIHDDTSGKVNFISSLKGGGDCGMWASMYQDDAMILGLNGGIRPGTMPLAVEDRSLELRDRFFTPPCPYPSCG